MAVDNNITTFWKTKKVSGKKASTSEWITIDLGNIATITRIELEWDTYYATQYLIRVSNDDINWTTLFSTNAGDGSNDTIYLNSISGRYIQLESTAWLNGVFRNWLREFKIFGHFDPSLPTNTPTPTVPSSSTATLVPSATMESVTSIHVGDLDSTTQTIGKKWRAYVAVIVHDNNRNPVANATVYGTWSNGITDSCTTDNSGTCRMTNGKIIGTSIIFTINDINYLSLPYTIIDNHDSDGDSNGNSISIQMP